MENNRIIKIDIEKDVFGARFDDVLTNTCELAVLPKIPAKMIGYDADEDFPCEIQILYDDNSPRFLSFECMAFLNGCLINALIKNV